MSRVRWWRFVEHDIAAFPRGGAPSTQVNDYLDSYKWIKKNTPKDSRVMRCGST